MPDIEIRFDGERLGREIASAARLIASGLPKAMDRALLVLERRVKDRHLSGPTGSTSLRARSARLRDSITSRLTIEAGVPVGTVGTKVIYGRTHEFGGTIRPRRGRFLTVPLPAALTPAGVGRFTARELINNPEQAGFTGTWIAKSIIFGRRGRTQRSRPVPLFVLKRSIKLPARPFLLTSLIGARQEIEAIFGEELARGLEFGGEGA